MGVTVGLYKHYKGTVYSVIAMATDTETGHDVAIYIALADEEKEDATIWARPASMFFEVVKNEEGQDVQRFERL